MTRKWEFVDVCLRWTWLPAGFTKLTILCGIPFAEDTDKLTRIIEEFLLFSLLVCCLPFHPKPGFLGIKILKVRLKREKVYAHSEAFVGRTNC